MADRIIKIKQAAHNVQEQYAANVSTPSLEDDMADIGVAIFNTCRAPLPLQQSAYGEN
jgi:hypothetical protein